MQMDPSAQQPVPELVEELVTETVDELHDDVAARRNHRVVLARLRQLRELLDADTVAAIV
jgi:hypothetical protein